MPKHSDSLKSFFRPKSIAVAGASTDPDKLGSIIFSNLLTNRRDGRLKASVYPVNPSYPTIGEERCYPDFASLPEPPELVILAVPAKLTSGLSKSAAAAGAKALVVISGGYAEVGNVSEEQEIRMVARKHGMRVLGPNTIGLVDTLSGVDSLFIRPTKSMPDGEEVESVVKTIPGGVAVITQSGYLGEAISAELASQGVGVRAIVGTGNQLDVSVEDVLEYFGEDPHTRVLAIYLEGVRDGGRFMRSAAAVAKRKPIVVFKVGKTDRGAKAALTHTASMVGDYEVYRAAFRQSGVVEAASLQELVDYAVALDRLPRKPVGRVAILTNAGGVGAIAADEAVRRGLKVAPLGAEGVSSVKSSLDGAGFLGNSSFANPIDLTASVSSDDFARVTERVLALQECDGAVVLPTHQAPGMKHDVGGVFGRAVAGAKKPAALCVMGPDQMAARIRRELMSMGVPSFPTPERAVGAIAAVSRYCLLRKGIASASAPNRKVGVPRRRRPDPPSLAALLRSCGLRVPRSAVVTSVSGVAGARLRFPLACKLVSKDLPHKTDVGGVLLGVQDVAEAKAAFSKLTGVARREGARFDGMLMQEMVTGGVELILGITTDETFGPVLTLGLGGTNAELLKEYVLAVAPVTASEVRSLLAGSRILKAIQGYRGGPRVDISALCRGAAKFSEALFEAGLPEVEINPLVATGEGLHAVDVRVSPAEG